MMAIKVLHIGIWAGLIIRPDIACADAIAKLSALPVMQRVQGGQEAIVNLTVANTGNVKLAISDNVTPSDVESSYTIDIHDQNGHVPELTEVGKELANPFRAEEEHDALLLPGDSVSEVFKVNDLYILRPNTVYRMSFSTVLSTAARTELIAKSNWVFINRK